MSSLPQLPSLFEQLRSHIEQFLLLLSQKERFVIERRFNLDDKSRSTLEEIGQHFNVTRERIRQIEKNALQKLRRNVENSPLVLVNNVVFDHLQMMGGLMKEDQLISKLIEGGTGFSSSAIRLIICLDKRFERLLNTIYYHPYVKFRTLNEDFVENVCKQSLVFLRKHKDLMPITQMLPELKKSIGDHQFLTKESLTSIFFIHKNFKVVDDSVGLLEWRHIHPRTLRDKIFFILRNEHKALHFVEIANRIIKAQFDQKNINLQAVHNELIRSEDFILIGRGIYALKEWGYVSGTVADVIISILKNKSLHQDEIVEEVLKKRHVKPITILLNLKNNSSFVRTGRKQYTLKQGATK